jgi:hypothetical protein
MVEMAGCPGRWIIYFCPAGATPDLRIFRERLGIVRYWATANGVCVRRTTSPRQQPAPQARSRPRRRDRRRAGRRHFVSVRADSGTIRGRWRRSSVPIISRCIRSRRLATAKELVRWPAEAYAGVSRSDLPVLGRGAFLRRPGRFTGRIRGRSNHSRTRLASGDAKAPVVGPRAENRREPSPVRRADFARGEEPAPAPEHPVRGLGGTNRVRDRRLTSRPPSSNCRVKPAELDPCIGRGELPPYLDT